MSLFPPYPVLGVEERNAVLRVLDSGRLSYFLASPGEYFYGGKEVKELERLFREYHNIKYAVAFNSATAALHAAALACGVKNPEDEVITTPYTFTSSATCAIMAGGKPVFADIDEHTYNISPFEIEKKITPQTKAIIPVHVFGNPCDMERIMKLAGNNGIKIIEDCAQAPGARYRDQLVGTIGDCGVISLTENKNITSGEGGMLITDDSHIAEVAQNIRNHGEACGYHMVGYNYRITEMDAAIGAEQFKKLDGFNDERRALAEYVTDGLKSVDGIKPQVIHPRDEHVFFMFGMTYSNPKMSRNEFVDRMNYYGIPLIAGYAKPLYYMNIYRKYGYEPGLCPVTEKCHFEKVINTIVIRPPATMKHMDLILNIMRNRL
jgi:dTDP-4-amino-4,6-dideoxygalactose transaminase